MIKLQNPKGILISAFEYALRRSSYVVNEVVTELISNWDEFEVYEQEKFKSEINYHIDLFGKSMSKHSIEQWKLILEMEVKK